MTKDNEGLNEGDSILDLKRKDNQEILEISSTGYGLESVSQEAEAKEKNKNLSCGGL
jgi:hypothetical protein